LVASGNAVTAQNTALTGIDVSFCCIASVLPFQAHALMNAVAIAWDAWRDVGKWRVKTKTFGWIAFLRFFFFFSLVYRWRRREISVTNNGIWRFRAANYNCWRVMATDDI